MLKLSHISPILFLLTLTACQVREAETLPVIETLEENFAAEAVPLSDTRNDYGVELRWTEAKPDSITREYDFKDAYGAPKQATSWVREQFGTSSVIQKKVENGVTYTYTPTTKSDFIFRPEKIQLTIPQEPLLSNDTLAHDFTKDHPIHGFHSARVYLKPGETIFWPAGRLEIKGSQIFADHHYAANTVSSESPVDIVIAPADRTLEERVKAVSPPNVANLREWYKGSVDFSIYSEKARGALKLHLDKSLSVERPAEVNIWISDPRGFKLDVTTAALPQAIKQQFIRLGSFNFILTENELISVQSIAGLYRRKTPGEERYVFINYSAQRSSFEPDPKDPLKVKAKYGSPLRNWLERPMMTDYDKIEITKNNPDIPPSLLASVRMNDLCYGLAGEFAKEGRTIEIHAYGNDSFTEAQRKLLELVRSRQEEFVGVMKKKEIRLLTVTLESAKGSPYAEYSRRHVVFDRGVSDDTEAEYQKALKAMREMTRPKD